MNLRPMTMSDEDIDFMLSLKNDPQTRKFAIATHDEIKREDHVKWLEQNIQYFQVIEYEISGIPAAIRAGAIRVQDCEISIWIDRAFRKQGVATNVLKNFDREVHNLPGKPYTAKIVSGNIASMRTFIKAGFLPVEYVNGKTPNPHETNATYLEPDYYIFKK